MTEEKQTTKRGRGRPRLDITDEERKQRIRASKRAWVKKNHDKYKEYNKKAYQKRKIIQNNSECEVIKKHLHHQGHLLKC